MATYYVNFNTGSNTNTGLSAGAAWKECPGTVNPVGAPTTGWVTIAKGSTVLFAAGQTWTRNITISTAYFEDPTQESERITLKSDSTATRAIFDLTGVSTGAIIRVDGIDYVSLEYLELCNLTNAGTAAGIRVGNSPVNNQTKYLKVQYCYIHDLIDSSVREGYGILNDECAYCTYAYNDIKNCEKKLISFNEVETSRLGCDHNYVHHNILHQDAAGWGGSGLDHGIACAGTYNEIYNNILWTDQDPGAAPSYAFIFSVSVFCASASGFFCESCEMSRAMVDCHLYLRYGVDICFAIARRKALYPFSSRV